MRQYAIDLDAAGDKAMAELQRRRLLLVTDKSLPNLVTMIVGTPVRGSWWAHPLCHEIYMVSQHLERHADVLMVKLVNRKTTYVHRSLWPALYAVASGREGWQMQGLSAAARSLLTEVDDRGRLRLDELHSRRTMKEISEGARTLESRLLVFGDDVHTDSGAHVKRIETWKRWASRASFVPDSRTSASEGRAALDSVAEDWRRHFETKVFLPWHAPTKVA